MGTAEEELAELDYDETGRKRIDKEIGSYLDFPVHLVLGRSDATKSMLSLTEISYSVLLAGEMKSYSASLSMSGVGNIIKIENLVSSIPTTIQATRDEIVELKGKIAAFEADMSQPFELEERLVFYLDRQLAVNKELNMDQVENNLIMDMEESPAKMPIPR